MLIKGIQVNNSAIPYTGTITELNDTEFTVRIVGRMGILKLPLRALICKNQPKVGDEVKFLMSLVEMKDDNYEQEEQ